MEKMNQIFGEKIEENHHIGVSLDTMSIIMNQIIQEKMIVFQERTIHIIKIVKIMKNMNLKVGHLLAIHIIKDLVLQIHLHHHHILTNLKCTIHTP